MRTVLTHINDLQTGDIVIVDGERCEVLVVNDICVVIYPTEIGSVQVFERNPNVTSSEDLFFYRRESFIRGALRTRKTRVYRNLTTGKMGVGNTSCDTVVED